MQQDVEIHRQPSDASKYVLPSSQSPKHGDPRAAQIQQTSTTETRKSYQNFRLDFHREKKSDV